MGSNVFIVKKPFVLLGLIDSLIQLKQRCGASFHAEHLQALSVTRNAALKSGTNGRASLLESHAPPPPPPAVLVTDAEGLYCEWLLQRAAKAACSNSAVETHTKII